MEFSELLAGVDSADGFSAVERNPSNLVGAGEEHKVLINGTGHNVIHDSNFFVGVLELNEGFAVKDFRHFDPLATLVVAAID